jgi:hypothetical protein
MRPVSILKRARSISGESPTRSAITAAAGEVATATAAAAAAVAVAAGANLGSDETGLFAAAAAVAAAGEDDDMEVDAKVQPVAAACSSPSASRTLPPLPPSIQAAVKACAACAAGSSPARPAAAGDAVLAVQGSFGITRSGQHYYELDDPAAALAALEHDMAALMMSLDKVRGSCCCGVFHFDDQLLLSSFWF